MSCRERTTLLTRVKQNILGIAGRSFISKTCQILNSKKYIFLMYHGVVRDDAMCAQDDWLQLNESSFREQMAFLKQHYNVVSLKDILHNTVSATDSRPKVVITFDDGYANNYTIAYPILKELGLPATIFLVTDVIGTDRLYWYDRLFTALQKSMPLSTALKTIEQFKEVHPHIVNEKVDDYFKNHGLPLRLPEEVYACYRVLTHAEINEMAASGLITFGSHTHQHELLTLMTNREVQYTLSKSLDILQDIPNKINVFCYPNGYYDASTHLQLCRSVGYTLAVTTKGGIWSPTTPDFEVPRWGIGRGFDINRFSAVVSGALHLLRTLTLR